MMNTPICAQTGRKNETANADNAPIANQIETSWHVASSAITSITNTIAHTIGFIKIFTSFQAIFSKICYLRLKLL